MDRYPQCYKCQLNQDGICKHDNKPVTSKSQIFGICKFVKWPKKGGKEDETNMPRLQTSIQHKRKLSKLP